MYDKMGREMKLGRKCLDDQCAGWKLKLNPICGWYFIGRDPDGVERGTISVEEMEHYVLTYHTEPLMQWEKEIYNG